MSIVWDHLDSRLFCFHDEGYNFWAVESRFRERKESSIKMKFKVEGGLLTKDDTIVMWG